MRLTQQKPVMVHPSPGATRKKGDDCPSVTILWVGIKYFNDLNIILQIMKSSPIPTTPTKNVGKD